MKQKFSIIAQGHSMYPLLRDGDMLKYTRVPFNTINLNDVVLTYVDALFITHRVIYKTKNTYITRGDNNNKADAPLQKARAIAKVIRFKRSGIWHEIQEVYFTQSALYLTEINKFATLFQLNKISHVFLKGVLVSLRYEGAIPKRIYADCDILVSRDQMSQIGSIMKRLGYVAVDKPLTTQINKNKYPVPPEISYVKMVRGVPIVFDIHFEPVFLMTQLGGMNLLYPKKQLLSLGNKMINNREVKKVKGFKYSLCKPSDQILYLSLHIFHHNYTDSIRYQLLDAVIRKSTSKKIWEDLGVTIGEFHLEGYTYGVFLLLKRYFKTSIPPSFFTKIRPTGFKFQVLSFKINNTDIFSQDSQIKAGIGRFILIFLLSPESIWKKSLLLIQPEVTYVGIRLVYSIFFSYVSQVRRQFSRK